MKHITRYIFLPLLAILIAFSILQDPIQYKTSADGRIYVDIKDFGAVGNGLADDSGAIQKAIDAVAGISGTVIIPGGLFRMAKGVKVPKGVSVEGMTAATPGPWQSWLDAKDKGGPAVFGDSEGALWGSAQYMRGSWILADNDVGDINGSPTFQLDGSTSISKIGFITRSLTPVTSMPNLSPPLIAVFSDKVSSDARSGITIDNISLANPYIGIAIVQGSDIGDYYAGKASKNSDVGKIMISNIMGSPQYKGIIVKGISSLVEMSNLQFNYSNYVGSHVEMRMQMATDVELAGAGNVTITDMLTFGAYSGIVTKPAYGRKVVLTARNINLEGQIPISLQSSGTYNISNSYFFMVNFGNAASESAFRAIEIIQDTASTQGCTYNFTNCMIQNPIIFTDSANEKWNDISIDMTLGANAKANFTNIQHYGFDKTGQEPIIRYHHQAGAGTDVVFNSFNFITDFTNPLITVSGNAVRQGEITFINARFPSAARLPQGDKIRYVRCTRYSGATNVFFEQ
ncbi:MAG: glycosyl hydrolase family 28-related protein [Saccharofermentanales bacterium]